MEHMQSVPRDSKDSGVAANCWCTNITKEANEKPLFVKGTPTWQPLVKIFEGSSRILKDLHEDL